MIEVNELIKPITDRMAELHKKIETLNDSIKYEILCGHDLLLAQDDRREYQREYNNLKQQLLDFHSEKRYQEINDILKKIREIEGRIERNQQRLDNDPDMSTAVRDEIKMNNSTCVDMLTELNLQLKQYEKSKDQTEGT